ncbi:MAG: ATP-binding protein [Cellulophaga sp.]
MSIKLHRLLKRQLKKGGVDEQTQLLIAPLLDQVNEAYMSFDSDLYHIETVLEKSSQELYHANIQLQSNVETISSQLTKIAGNIREVIFEMDLNGNWSYLNPAWETLTGLNVQENIGKPYYIFMKDEKGKPLQNLIDLDNPNANTFSKSIKCLTTVGEKKWLDFSIKVIKTDKGIAEGYIGTIVDITNLKKTELALIKAKIKETKANKAKDEFLSTMSHEIRTPLNAVIGISHLLLLENPKIEQLENLNALKYSSEHLLDLVNDILDFNKIASGLLELEKTDFSLEHILNGLHSIFHHKAKEKNIMFIIKKDTSLPQMLIGDSTRVSQILTNLISNAIKFTEEGKVILDIEVAEETKDSYQLDFMIKDTGIGIPEDKKDKVFQSFAQANSDTTRKYGGSGLGLAICTRLLEIMGSTLNLESVEDKGSEFCFSLNFKKSEITNFHESTYKIDGKLDDLKGVKILVAEDNKLNIMVIEKFLTQWKADYDIAENGLIALDKAISNDYDMILMDLQMPVMNGFDAAKAIRKSNNPLNKIIPIYALSASTGVNIKSKIKDFGMNGLICKPFNPTELYRTITKILRKEFVA